MSRKKNPFRLQYNLYDVMKFTAIFSLVLAVFAWQGIGLGMPDSLWSFSIATQIFTALIITVTIMVKHKKPQTPRCVLCGRPCLVWPWTETPPDKCPACQTGRLPASAQQRVQRRALLALIVLTGLLVAALLLPFADLITSRTGMTPWLVLPLMIVPAWILLFLSIIVVLVAQQLVRTYRLARPGRALAVAQVCAGTEGEPEQFGLTTAWGFGSKAPAGDLNREMAIAAEHYTALTGEPTERLRPLDAFVFAKRSAFESFLKRAFPIQGLDHDAMFIAWPMLTITFTTDPPPWRLSELDRSLRLLSAYHLLASRPTPIVSSWLQAGLANVIACGADDAERDRLNRKMLAALAAGRSLPAAALFDPRSRTLASLRNLKDHRQFMRYVQYVTQSWSVVEFLCGPHSPPGQAETFRAFLRDLGPPRQAPAVFERHFGFGYERLLADWSAWVQAHGTATFTAPPQRTEDRLHDRVLPLIRDASTPLDTRVRAVRELGRAGHPCGADVLIALLHAPAPVLKPEILWALESISGTVLGDDPTRWVHWWQSLPPEAHGTPLEVMEEPVGVLG